VKHSSGEPRVQAQLAMGHREPSCQAAITLLEAAVRVTRRVGTLWMSGGDQRSKRPGIRACDALGWLQSSQGVP
jgi:hypothetical protein